MEWPFIKVGDMVMIHEHGINAVNYSKDIRDDYLASLNYKVIKVVNQNDCSENNPLCSCDKYITVENKETRIKLDGIILDEIIIKELI